MMDLVQALPQEDRDARLAMTRLSTTSPEPDRPLRLRILQTNQSQQMPLLRLLRVQLHPNAEADHPRTHSLKPKSQPLLLQQDEVFSRTVKMQPTRGLLHDQMSKLLADLQQVLRRDVHLRLHNLLHLPRRSLQSRLQSSGVGEGQARSKRPEVDQARRSKAPKTPI